MKEGQGDGGGVNVKGCTGSVLCRFCLLPLGLVVSRPAPPGTPDLTTARQGAGETSGSGWLGNIPGSSGVWSVL